MKCPSTRSYFFILLDILSKVTDSCEDNEVSQVLGCTSERDLGVLKAVLMTRDAVSWVVVLKSQES